MKRQTYIRFFKKWIKRPQARILFVPDEYYKTCLEIMYKNYCYQVGIVKKSNEDKYWSSYFLAGDEEW